MSLTSNFFRKKGNQTMVQASNQALGHAYSPLHGQQLENPYPFYACAREQEPVFYSQHFNAWVVTRYDDALSILGQPHVFSSRDTLRPLVTFSPRVQEELLKGYPVGTSVVNSDGKDHARLRTPQQKALSPLRVKAMEPFIRTIGHSLLDGFLNDGQAEMIAQFAYPLPLEVICRLLGIPKEDMTNVRRWTLDRRALISSPLSEEEQMICARSLVALQHYFLGLIKERSKTPQDDLITDLLVTSQQEGKPFDEKELMNTFISLVAAGHETTTNLIGNGLLLLLQHRAQWQALCAHPDLIPTAVEEMLRYDAPAHAFYRTTTQQATVGGVTMPAGTLLLVVFASANHDEAQFPQAEQFNIQRTPNRHQSFGYGVHFCLGAPLARLEGRIAFEILTQRLPNLRLKAPQSYSRASTLMFRGLSHLEVVWNDGEESHLM